MPLRCGRRQRQERLAAEQAEMEGAATTIQTRYRGMSGRKKRAAIDAERQAAREKIEMELSSTKIQASFRGRKGRRQAAEEQASLLRLGELEQRARRMFAGRTTGHAFSSWCEYRSRIQKLRASSLRKLNSGLALHVFEHWAECVDNTVAIRQEAVLQTTQELVDRAVQQEPLTALADGLSASGAPVGDIVDIREMASKLATRPVGSILCRAVSEAKVRKQLDEAFRRATGGARADLPRKMREASEPVKSDGLWGRLTGSGSGPLPPPPGVHIRLHSLARAAEGAVTVAVEILESVHVYPQAEDMHGPMRCTLRRENPDGTPLPGTAVHRSWSAPPSGATAARTASHPSLASGLSSDKFLDAFLADPDNDPLAAPYAGVLVQGKGSGPPLLPWTAGALRVDDGGSAAAEGHQPPQRQARMINSTGRVIAPGRQLNSIPELGSGAEDGEEEGPGRWKAYCPAAGEQREFGGDARRVLPAIFLVEDVKAERIGGFIESAAGRKLGSFRVGLKDLRDKALECGDFRTHYSSASWETIKPPPPSLSVRLLHQSKDPMADPTTGGSCTLEVEVVAAFALPSDGGDISDPYCRLQLIDKSGKTVGEVRRDSCPPCSAFLPPLPAQAGNACFVVHRRSRLQPSTTRWIRAGTRPSPTTCRLRAHRRHPTPS